MHWFSKAAAPDVHGVHDVMQLVCLTVPNQQACVLCTAAAKHPLRH
jgi:hypothetical protein